MSDSDTLSSRVAKAGISISTYYYRIRKGMSPEEALKAPAQKVKQYKQRRTGETRTLVEWAAHLGISQSAMYARVRKYGPNSQKLFHSREQAEQERLKSLRARAKLDAAARAEAKAQEATD